MPMKDLSEVGFHHQVDQPGIVSEIDAGLC